MTRPLIYSYNELLKKARDISILKSVNSVIRWDMETMMPPGAIKLRSQQLALFSRIGHKMITNPEIGKLLGRITRNPEYEKLNSIQQRNVYLMKKNYDEQTKLPEDLVAETATQKAITVDAWKKAKAAKDFSMYKSKLEKLVELKKRAAEILMETKEAVTPYDALIDIFEPKMSERTIAKIFGELRESLLSLAKKCQTALEQPKVSILKRHVPINIQRRVSKTIAQFVEYDTESKEARGRIDETEHPFTTGYYDDVRVTTHYYEENFTSAIFSTLHECGHALYDQNLKAEWMFQPVGTPCSMGIHESQSRFLENIVGRSREFWIFFLPKLKKLTGKILSKVDLDDFVFAINQVRPSKIRIEADEVTYGLHIIIRFKIERDIFADKITVTELPEIWNQSYEDYLGVDVENDSEGVMQDTHWASGLFGYFPSYTLGNIYSGQILAAMERNLSEWKNQVAQGNFRDIKQWLIKNIHNHGDLYDPLDLLKKTSGEELSIEPYLNYLNRKYSKLYSFR
jgi:carboxypeptidase Taq